MKILYKKYQMIECSGAILQIDDYLYWPGAKKATDETEWLRGYSRKLVGNALIIDTSI